MPTVRIVRRFDSAKVLFEHEVSDKVQASGLALRHALEAAATAGANLSCANLSCANLSCANLSCANLSGANLSGADLSGADLSDANLSDANLSDADLSGANLSDADLSGANLSCADLSDANLSDADLSGADLSGANLSCANLSCANLSCANLSCANLSGANLSCAKLVGKRPVLQIGPIGSRADYLLAFLTDAGVTVRAGCYYGTRDEFAARAAEEHADNVHGREYAAALAMIDAHAALWTPAPTFEERPAQMAEVAS